MAVAFNNGGVSIAVAASLSFSYTASAGADRLLLCAGEAQDSVFSGVTFDGAPLTAGPTRTGILGTITTWYKTGAATGAKTLTFTPASGYAAMFGAFSDWTGVHQTAPIGSAVTNVDSDNGSTWSSGSITVPTDGLAWAYGRNIYTSGGSFSGGTDTTLIGGNRNGGTGQGQAHGYRATTGSVNINMPSGTSTVNIIGFALNPAEATPDPGLDFDDIGEELGNVSGSEFDDVGLAAATSVRVAVFEVDWPMPAPLLTFTETTDANGCLARRTSALLTTGDPYIIHVRDTTTGLLLATYRMTATA
jgi:hypothetical protein